MMFGWCSDDVWMIFGWCLEDNVCMMRWWCLNDVWMLIGWYVTKAFYVFYYELRRCFKNDESNCLVLHIYIYIYVYIHIYMYTYIYIYKLCCCWSSWRYSCLQTMYEDITNTSSCMFYFILFHLVVRQVGRRSLHF